MLISTLAPRDLVERTPRIDARKVGTMLRRHPRGAYAAVNAPGVRFTVRLGSIPSGDAHEPASDPGDAYAAPEDAGEVVATFHGIGDVRARLVALRAGFGGWRLMAECPACGRAVAVLYAPPWRRALACRACHGLAYASQRLTGHETARARRMRASAALGIEDGGDTNEHVWADRTKKPARMRWATWGRLAAEWHRADRAFLEEDERLWRAFFRGRYRLSVAGGYSHEARWLRTVPDPMV